MAAAFISNCGSTSSGRLEFIHHLQKYVDVDIYGGCGNFTCPTKDRKACWYQLNKHYKFLMAFENSLCKDYITQRLIETLKYRVVPIVIDPDGYYPKFAPPGSYINALDFPKMKDLADYLKKLDQNDALYNKYHAWRGHFRIHSNVEHDRKVLCTLCASLHQKEIRIHENITDWWSTQSSCKKLFFPMNDLNNDTWVVEPLA